MTVKHYHEINCSEVPHVHADLRERVTGIEPAYLAWEASALPLSYTRTTRLTGYPRRRWYKNILTPADGKAVHYGSVALCPP